MYEHTDQMHFYDCRTFLTWEIIHLCTHTVSNNLANQHSRVASGWWLYIYIFWAPLPCRLLTAALTHHLSPHLGARHFANTEHCAQTFSVGWNSLCLHLLSATLFFSLQLISLHHLLTTLLNDLNKYFLAALEIIYSNVHPHPPPIAFSPLFSTVSYSKGAKWQLTAFDQRGVRFNNVSYLSVTPQTSPP